MILLLKFSEGKTNQLRNKALCLISMFCCASAGASAGVNPQAAKLTLQQAMQLGSEKPFQVRIAREQAVEAQARASQALAGLFPRIDADAQHIRFDKQLNKATGKIFAPQFPAEVTTAAVQVSQPIFGLLPLTLQARATSLMSDSAQESAGQARRDGALLGAQAFLNAVRSHQFHALAQASLLLAEKQKSDADALFRAGKLSLADALRFELSVADASSQVTQANVSKQLAFIALNDSLGLSVTENDLEVPLSSVVEEKKPAAPQLDDVVKRAVERRPELKAARVQLKIAELTAWAARLDYSPSVNAFARYERDFEAQDIRSRNADGSAGALLAAKDDVRNKLAVGLQLKWQIWDWGSRWSKITETVAQRTKAEINAEQALSLLRTEVIKSWLDYKAAEDALKTSLSSVKLAQEVYKLTQARFANGQASSTDLITSERDQARARAGLVSARSDVDLAWFRLQRNMGEQPSI